MTKKTLSLEEYQNLCGGWHICKCFENPIKVMPLEKHKKMMSIKVQGLITTIEELEEIVKELKAELNDSPPNIHWQLNIINKDNTSDGWTFDRRKT